MENRAEILGRMQRPRIPFPDIAIFVFSSPILGAMALEVGGHETRQDWPKLGPSLLIATALILAIRTARWTPHLDTAERQCDLDQEIEFAAHVSGRILAALVKKWPTLYPRTRQPWYKATEEEQPQ